MQAALRKPQTMALTASKPPVPKHHVACPTPSLRLLSLLQSSNFECLFPKPPFSPRAFIHGAYTACLALRGQQGTDT